MPDFEAIAYRYSGLLRNQIEPPSAKAVKKADAVAFTADDLFQWPLGQRDREPEWLHIPAKRRRTEHGVALEGDFSGVKRLDMTGNVPRFWVALTSDDAPGSHFPVDLQRYPIFEITYRCTSPDARPACVWTYPGGMYLCGLGRTREWTTVARRIPHYGFPHKVESLSFRLYSVQRSVESIEVAQVRFRAATPEEEAAAKAYEKRVDAECKAPDYAGLDDFLPLGTFMDAETAQRQIEALGLSPRDYWRLTLEDIARHHHNCIALEKADAFSTEELRNLLAMSAPHGIRFVFMYRFPVGASEPEKKAFVAKRIAPFRDSRNLFAWNIYAPPSERSFPKVAAMKTMIEQADPVHPLALMCEYPNAFSLYARHFAASGIAHYASHKPWSVATMIQEHLPAAAGGNFWLLAPGFVYPSDTPDWNGCPEMRLMLNIAFASGIRGWFSYTFHSAPAWVSGSSQRSLTGSFLTFSDLWAELGHRMHRFNALAPLFLETKPEPRLQKWFTSTNAVHSRSQLPADIPPTTVYRLRARSFDLYYVVSNDITEMTTESIDISESRTRSLSFYDLTDFLRDRLWNPMDRARRLEMFPGQAHVILAAKPAVCNRWRDTIARRLLEDDLRQFEFAYRLACAYGIDVGKVEKLVRATGKSSALGALEIMKQARDQLLDALYDTPALYEPRSKLIEASAALTGCDTLLCAMLARGHVDQGQQFGAQVAPLAQELAHLRLELRAGKGKAIKRACNDLADRAVKLLGRIHHAGPVPKQKRR